MKGKEPRSSWRSWRGITVGRRHICDVGRARLLMWCVSRALGHWGATADSIQGEQSVWGWGTEEGGSL